MSRPRGGSDGQRPTGEEGPWIAHCRPETTFTLGNALSLQSSTINSDLHVPLVDGDVVGVLLGGAADLVGGHVIRATGSGPTKRGISNV